MPAARTVGERRDACALDAHRADAACRLDRLHVRQEQHVDRHERSGASSSELGLAGQQVKLGLARSGLFLAYGIFAPLWGWAGAALSARARPAALSLVVWALTCFWSGVPQSYDLLLVVAHRARRRRSGALSDDLALVANWFALKERGRATSFWWIGTMIGPMLVGLIITGLIVSVGWRWQFHAMGILALILPLPMVWFLVRGQAGAASRVSMRRRPTLVTARIAREQRGRARAAPGAGRQRLDQLPLLAGDNRHLARTRSSSGAGRSGCRPICAPTRHFSSAPRAI